MPASYIPFGGGDKRPPIWKEALCRLKWSVRVKHQTKREMTQHKSRPARQQTISRPTLASCSLGITIHKKGLTGAQETYKPFGTTAKGSRSSWRPRKHKRQQAARHLSLSRPRSICRGSHHTTPWQPPFLPHATILRPNEMRMCAGDLLSSRKTGFGGWR